MQPWKNKHNVVAAAGSRKKGFYLVCFVIFFLNHSKNETTRLHLKPRSQIVSVTLTDKTYHVHRKE